jgi:3,4-dihydroxy 2-butanone 4-phosphate synthase / GTP cyclohydrolase II
MTSEAVGRVERALEEIRRGRMVILCDDEDRENEGDLCMAADAATPEAIAFMASKGRGLICVALTPERVEQLRLPMMVRDNRSRFGTNFTVSIEARQGVTTGISAADRATTVRTAADPHKGPDDIVAPGHIFPLRAMPGGVLQRSGQTEGAVDLARLAGRVPAGVICEIMNEDGTMARRPELERFAREHGLALLCVVDLIAYRLQR